MYMALKRAAWRQSLSVIRARVTDCASRNIVSTRWNGRLTGLIVT